MDNLDSNTVAVVAVIAVLAGARAWPHGRCSGGASRSVCSNASAPNTHTRCDRMGSRDKAEAELLARERRVERLHLQPLSPADAERFTREWKRLQGRFVDDPRGSLAEADLVVRELMIVRGYPMGDFERRAADISVDHAAVVDHYRAAHAIAVRDDSGAGADRRPAQGRGALPRAVRRLARSGARAASSRHLNPRLMETH